MTFCHQGVVLSEPVWPRVLFGFTGSGLGVFFSDMSIFQVSSSEKLSKNGHFPKKNTQNSNCSMTFCHQGVVLSEPVWPRVLVGFTGSGLGGFFSDMSIFQVSLSEKLSKNGRITKKNTQNSNCSMTFCHQGVVLCTPVWPMVLVCFTGSGLGVFLGICPFFKYV